MTIRTIRKIMFTESAGQVVLVPRELQLPCSPLTMLNRLVIWLLFSLSLNSRSTLALPKWSATAVAAAVVTDGVAVAVAVVAVSPLPMLPRWATTAA
ncbi:ATP-dependent RNA helicase DBP2, partial [Emergomyces africanus]